MAVQKGQKIEKFSTVPGAEALGASMLALPICLKADEIMPLLKKHGFAEIEAGTWYPQQNILDLYREIEEGHTNLTENLVSIGIKSVETMEFPPEVNTMESVIAAMAASYSMAHRNLSPNEGTWYRFLSDGHVEVILNTPYPDDIFYGYYWGVMRKYLPKGANFRVTKTENDDAEYPGIVYDIRWGASL